MPLELGGHSDCYELDHEKPLLAQFLYMLNTSQLAVTRINVIFYVVIICHITCSYGEHTMGKTTPQKVYHLADSQMCIRRHAMLTKLVLEAFSQQNCRLTAKKVLNLLPRWAGPVSQSTVLNHASGC